MTPKFLKAIVLVGCLASVSVFAQERGRTDGPEGSEIGKGGYDDPGSGHFSLSLDWGGSTDFITPSGPNSVPLFVGLTASYWADEWFLVDLSGAYLGHDRSSQVLVGPRFRTATWPVSGWLGLKAGPMFTRPGVRFTLSPQVGGDLIVAEHILLGLGGAADIVVGGNNAYRLFMNVGYRF